MSRYLAIVAIALCAGGALAAPCKDPKTGRFIKCPQAVAVQTGVRCKDVKGKFAKCGSPGAKPVSPSRK